MYTQLLERKESKWIISGGWHEWDHKKRLEIIKLEGIKFKKQVEQSDFTDDLTLYREKQKSIDSISYRIESIKDELEQKLMFAAVITDLQQRDSST